MALTGQNQQVSPPDGIEARLTSIENSAAQNYASIMELLQKSIKSADDFKAELAKGIADVRESCGNLEIKISSNNNNLQLQHDDLKKFVEEKFASLESGSNTQPPPDQFDNIIDRLQKRIDYLEKDSKKMNIAIKGLLTSPERADRDVKNRLRSVTNQDEEVAEVRFIPLRGKIPHIVIVKLGSLESKKRILRSKKSLASNPIFRNVFIERDLTPLERKIAGRIRVLARIAKDDGKEVNFTPNWLTIDGTLFRWNDDLQDVVPSSSPPPNWSQRRIPNWMNTRPPANGAVLSQGTGSQTQTKNG